MNQLSKRQKEILAIAKESKSGELRFDRDSSTPESLEQQKELGSLKRLVGMGFIYEGRPILYFIYPSKITLVFGLTKKGWEFNDE